MSQGYYQLGGFRPQIQWFRSTYDDKSLAQAIAGPSSPLRVTQNPNDPVEVVLGIKRHGSSHLLLTVEQTQSFARAMALPLPNPRVTLAPREFESLSPITFSNVEAFTKKLSVLKPKAKKPGDSSQANRGYNDGRDNLYRGGFEHGRVLYRILGDMIDANTYGVEDTYWAENLRIRSLVFNTKGVDDRPAAERLKNPSILDIGICDATLPTLIPDYSSARHIIHSGNILLGRKGPKKPFIYGNSEIVTAAMMPHRIQEIFKEFQKATEKPMVLLVNRGEETVNFLRNMGVDVSAWQRYGLRDLLIPKNSQGRNWSPSGSMSNRRYSYENDMRSNSALPYDDYEARRDRVRSRSRSPSRNFGQRYDRYPSSSRQSGRAPQYQNVQSTHTSGGRRRLYAPVYVVDVQQLYVAMMQTQDVKTVVDIAHRFDVTDEEGWCAGNESGLLIDIWKSMISGPPIDEQRDLRSGGLGSTSETPEAEATAGPSGEPQPSYGSDDEQDPNDYVAKPQDLKKNTAAAQKDTYIDWDQSDYGSDSEESE